MGRSAIRIPKPVVSLSKEPILLRFRIALLTDPSIVAVHGMGAHPDDTWCNEIDSDDGPVSVNWLIDPRFLPAAFPRSRISRYGYHSRWFGEDAIRTKTSEISQGFLFDLNEYRKVRPCYQEITRLYPSSSILKRNIFRRTKTDPLFSSGMILVALSF
jgi:hypothetical protein